MLGEEAATWTYEIDSSARKFLEKVGNVGQKKFSNIFNIKSKI